MSRRDFEREPAATVRRRMPVAPEDVWSVLADGWSFGTWVVGACRIRSVDSDWPAAGTGIEHSVGAWPALLDDHTVVEESDPPRGLVLHARARPLGEAKVPPADGGGRSGTRPSSPCGRTSLPVPAGFCRGPFDGSCWFRATSSHCGGSSCSPGSPGAPGQGAGS